MNRVEIGTTSTLMLAALAMVPLLMGGPCGPVAVDGPITVNGDVNVGDDAIAIVTAPQFALVVTTIGHGGVTPTQGTYDDGVRVTLTASPEPGFRVKSWSGTNLDPSAGFSTNTVTMNGDKSVTVEFEPIPVNSCTLTVAVPGGHGSVNPAGGIFDNGTSVQLIATPDENYLFDHWTGDLTGTANPATLVMSGNKSVGAVFAAKSGSTVRDYTLTTSISPAGAGSVLRSPDLPSYNAGNTVTLTASAASGYAFDHWEGAAGGNNLTATVLMNADQSATAVFVPVYTLATAVSPESAGTVTWSPDQPSYRGGDVVTLSASTAAGYVFDHWTVSGGSDVADPSSMNTTVTMDTSKTVTAVFVPVYTLIVAVSPDGAGTVTRSPDQLSYRSGEVVALTAMPASGYVFDHWTVAGGSDVADPSTSATAVVMDVSKTTTAVFVPEYLVWIDIRGEGTVEPLVDVWGDGTTYAALYPENACIAITATPQAGYKFDHWEGDVGGSTNPLSAIVETDLFLTAVFTPRYTSADLLQINITCATVETVFPQEPLPAQYQRRDHDYQRDDLGRLIGVTGDYTFASGHVYTIQFYFSYDSYGCYESVYAGGRVTIDGIPYGFSCLCDRGGGCQ